MKKKKESCKVQVKLNGITVVVLIDYLVNSIIDSYLN